MTISNATGKPLYETPWSLDPRQVTWNGPALVFSGLDVLGNRRLIFFPADREEPKIPLPLRSGATWRGTITGKLPDEPRLPRGSPIWIHYPTFGVGQVWLGPGSTAGTGVQWISAKGFQL